MEAPFKSLQMFICYAWNVNRKFICDVLRVSILVCVLCFQSRSELVQAICVAEGYDTQALLIEEAAQLVVEAKQAIPVCYCRS
jgi:hypothetical protein